MKLVHVFIYTVLALTVALLQVCCSAGSSYSTALLEYVKQHCFGAQYQKFNGDAVHVL